VRISSIVGLRGTIIWLLLMCLMTTASTARDLLLRPGFSELLKLGRPVGDVIVGDPDIADVTIQSEQQIVITAKPRIGMTNVIVLDRENKELFSANIIVAGSDIGKVEIHSRPNRNELHNYFAYNCPRTGGLCQRVKDELESLTRVELVGPAPPQISGPGLIQPSAPQAAPQTAPQ